MAGVTWLEMNEYGRCRNQRQESTSNSNYNSRYRDPKRDRDRNRRESKEFDPDSDFDFDCTDVPKLELLESGSPVLARTATTVILSAYGHSVCSDKLSPAAVLDPPLG
jgi:hypothetical protein